MARTQRVVRPRLAIFVLTLGAFVYSMLQSLVIPALTTIQRDLHTSTNASTWVVSSLLVSSAIATPLLGRLGDLFGRSRMLVVSLVALGVGCVISALASSIGVLIVGRVVQGVGGALAALSFSIVRDVSEPRHIAGNMGLVAAMLAVGAATGIVLSGPIATSLGYRWLFWLPLMVIAPITVAAMVVLPQSPRQASVPVDWWGAVLLSGWLFCLLFGVSEGPSWGWGSGRVVGLLALAVALLAGWIAFESRIAAPLVDMRLIRRPAILRVNLATLAIGFAIQATFTFVPRFVQIAKSTGFGLGVSASRAGLVALPWSAGSTVTGFALGRLAARYGPQRVMVVGASMSVVPFLGIIAWHDSVLAICVMLGVFGTGTGLMAAAMPTILVTSVEPDQVGVTAGMNMNVRTIGGAIGTQVVSTIIASGLRADGYGSEGVYVASFAVLAIACVLAAVATATVPASHEPLVRAPRMIDTAAEVG